MPRSRHSVILLFATATFVIAFMLTLRIVNSQKNVGAPPAILVVGAIRDVRVGSVIQKEDLDLLEAPPGVNPKVLYTDFKPVLGKISRRNIMKGEVVKTVDLLAEGDNLASLIPEGYRAMTIPVTLPSDILNLIQVGNRVDVILTYERVKNEIDSLTLIENVKVIGVTEPPAKGVAAKDMYITLAVTSIGAETLAYAMKKGTITVTVRSLRESEEGEEKFFNLKELFFDKKEASIMQEEAQVENIEIIRGVRKSKYNVTTSEESSVDTLGE